MANSLRTNFLRTRHRLLALATVAAAGLAAAPTAGAQTCSGTNPGGGAAAPGLYAEYFPGFFDDHQDYFSYTTPGLTRVDAQLNFTAINSWGNIVPPAINTVDNPDAFSVRYRGSLLITTAGTYTISLTADDGAYLWLDNPARRPVPLAAEATINNGGFHQVATVSATVTLTAGKHDLLVHYGENNGENVLVMQYSGPDTNNSLVVVPSTALCSSTTGLALAARPAAAEGGLVAQVLPNPSVAGAPVRVRLQQAVATPVQLTVSDLQGRLVGRQALPAATATDVPLAVPGLRSGGVYLLRFTSATGTLTQKLVVQ